MAKRGRFLAVMAALAAGISLTQVGCGGPKNPWNAKASPHVLASFPPIYCFAANVVDPQAEVQTLMVEDKDPHHYNPTLQDAWLVRDASFFFCNGLGLDDAAAQKAVDSTSNSNLKFVHLGERVPEKDRITVEKRIDPHVWLGLPEAILMVEGIRDALKAGVPERASAYEENAAAYIGKLRKLHEEGKEKFKGVPREARKIIAFHDSLRYFARAFDLEVAGVVEWEPGMAPTSKEVQELIRICKEQKVRVIVSEPLFDRANTEAKRILELLRDAGVDGVQIVEVDPIETASPGKASPPNCDKDHYENVMRDNIEKLAKAL